jgi:hypothetical protein
MLFVDAVPGANLELPLCAYQKQAFVDHDVAVVKEHVMVRAQTQDVVGHGWPAMRRPERSDVGCLCAFGLSMGKTREPTSGLEPLTCSSYE